MNINNFQKSRQLQSKAHRLIPGGAHTYAKGDDQFPWLAPGFIERGLGCYVWDVDGNRYIEYGMGCRAVTLGHGFQPIVDAVTEEITKGCNYSRPSVLELECAEELVGLIESAEMCKFSKNGSDATTAALKLARAVTGRKKVAFCHDQPFFSIDDWFIGTTAVNAGIPESAVQYSVGFPYNDLDALKDLFANNKDQIACLIMEAGKYHEPENGYLQAVQELCRANGTLFVMDEMITGFRWHNGGAQKIYDLDPDLSTFGKAMGNGFAVSALTGKEKYMKLGGLFHEDRRVFLLSTTHGAESAGLAAGMAVMRYYQSHPVVETLATNGEILRTELNKVIEKNQIGNHVSVIGRPSSLVFTTSDPDGKPSQGYRALLMQELIKRGVLGPSLINSIAHDPEVVKQTAIAFDGALAVYKQAIEKGLDEFLVGRPTQVVYRDKNDIGYQCEPNWASA